MKTVKAYIIRAKVTGKSWMTKGSTVKANSEAEAIERATKILNLTAEHQIECTEVIVYESGAKLETDDYPYGRLRATAFFSVEYNGNKGARTVFQTIDPKSGRLNKPKNSTYYRVLLPCRQVGNGHLDFAGYLDFNGTEAINKGLYFMADFFDMFTPEQIKSIALDIIAMSKVNAKASVIYAGIDWEALKPLISGSIDTLVNIAKTGENLFLSALLDYDKIEAMKPANFNPFKVVQY